MKPLLLVLLLWTVGTGRLPAQEEVSAPEPSYTEPMQPPAVVSGITVPMRLSSEETRSNLISGGISISTGYSDNVFASTQNPAGDTSYLIFPNIAVLQTKGRWNWDLGYSPGFSVNQRYNELNQSVHDLHFVLGYKLARHMTLQVRDNFDRTTTLFSGYGGSSGVIPGPLQGGNASVITPFANRTGNTTGADYLYQFGRNDLVGASVSYYFTNYADVRGTDTGYQLVDTASWVGDGFYVRRVGRRTTLGLAYNFQRLMFDPGPSTDVQRVLGLYSVNVNPHMTLTAWAGPEHAKTERVEQNDWEAAAGVQWNWVGSHNGWSAGYQRRTTDGGGLFGAVKMQDVNGEWRSRWARRLSTTVSGSYAFNESLLMTSGSTTLHGFAIGAGGEYQLRENVIAGFRYIRDEQKYVNTIPESTIQRNQVWFSLSYTFNRPFAR